MRMWWCCSRPGFKPRRISSVPSRLGSSTVTGRKRRSSAGSFSINFRYSVRVVAPRICSSPLPKAGLKMLAASIAPSAAPAPTMVCISSTNKIISPLRRISISTSRSRSSNSPRYLVPATRFAILRLMSRFSFSWGGTFPAAIRWASPSAMAVLPTPGSPTKAGLFLFFRHRIPTTASISRFLPITGSISPALATMSWPNCSKSFKYTVSFLGRSQDRPCRYSTVRVNKSSVSTLFKISRSRAADRCSRSIASSICSRRTCLLPRNSASIRAIRRSLLA